MDKLKCHSPGLSQENIAKIRELFPGCVTEAHDKATGQLRLAVDFGSVASGVERPYRGRAARAVSVGLAGEAGGTGARKCSDCQVIAPLP